MSAVAAHGQPVSILVAGVREAAGHPSGPRLRPPQTPVWPPTQPGHVCRTPTVRRAVVPEAADGQSADRSLVTTTSTLPQGPAGTRQPWTAADVIADASSRRTREAVGRARCQAQDRRLLRVAAPLRASHADPSPGGRLPPEDPSSGPPADGDRSSISARQEVCPMRHAAPSRPYSRPRTLDRPCEAHTPPPSLRMGGEYAEPSLRMRPIGPSPMGLLACMVDPAAGTFQSAVALACAMRADRAEPAGARARGREPRSSANGQARPARVRCRGALAAATPRRQARTQDPEHGPRSASSW